MIPADTPATEHDLAVAASPHISVGQAEHMERGGLPWPVSGDHTTLVQLIQLRRSLNATLSEALATGWAAL